MESFHGSVAERFFLALARLVGDQGFWHGVEAPLSKTGIMATTDRNLVGRYLQVSLSVL